MPGETLVTLASRATIQGIVFDGTRVAPLAGATVFLSGTKHTAVTGDDGRFRMEGLPAGEYAVGFRHPRLDSLGIVPATGHASLQRGQVATIELAIPSVERILAAGCPDGERQGGGGIVVGLVRDSITGLPLSSTEITLSWSQAEGTGQVNRLVTQTDGDGAFRFCAIPTGLAVTVRAHMLGRSSASQRVSVAEDVPVRVDLTVHLTQAVRVVGRVVDHESSEPITAASVVLAGTMLRSTTDEQGGFVFADVPPGSYTVAVEHLGYGSHTDSLFVGGAQTLDVEVRLAPRAIALDPITVTVRARSASPRLARFHERRDRGLRGHFITRAELERSTASKLTDVLRTVPGVRVVPGNGPRRYAVRMVRQPVRLGGARLSRAPAGERGPVDCPPQVYIDGIPWAGPIDEITLRDIEGIEVYRGAAEVPAEFAGSNAGCGVIALWSRRGG